MIKKKFFYIFRKKFFLVFFSSLILKSTFSDLYWSYYPNARPIFFFWSQKMVIFDENGHFWVILWKCTYDLTLSIFIQKWRIRVFFDAEIAYFHYLGFKFIFGFFVDLQKNFSHFLCQILVIFEKFVIKNYFWKKFWNFFLKFFFCSFIRKLTFKNLHIRFYLNYIGITYGLLANFGKKKNFFVFFKKFFWEVGGPEKKKIFFLAYLSLNYPNNTWFAEKNHYCGF